MPNKDGSSPQARLDEFPSAVGARRATEESPVKIHAIWGSAQSCCAQAWAWYGMILFPFRPRVISNISQMQRSVPRAAAVATPQLLGRKREKEARFSDGSSRMHGKNTVETCFPHPGRPNRGQSPPSPMHIGNTKHDPSMWDSGPWAFRSLGIPVLRQWGHLTATPLTPGWERGVCEGLHPHLISSHDRPELTS
jgi:hypothetical protein